MVRYYFILLLFLGIFSSLSAQTIKTKVLVVGGGVNGIGAAIQSAHSGVETVLIEKSNQLSWGIELDTTIQIGLQADFIKRYKQRRHLADSPPITEVELATGVLKGWADTIKNLSVILNAGVQKIEKSGKRWEVTLTDGRNIKTDIIVDATSADSVVKQVASDILKLIYPPDALAINSLYTNTIYRTGVVIGNRNSSIFPLPSFLFTNPENFIRIPKEIEKGLITGQAAGATAAYCAFFKTTTKNVNIRMIQGELLGYKSFLIPFSDIPLVDSNFTAIQHIAATGILKAKPQNKTLCFLPDSAVSFEEIRQSMKEYYSRSQIWFLDKKGEKLTLNDALSLIKFSGNRGEELNREVEKAWTTSFKFKGKPDLTKNITRREFAVLVDTYLKPFNVQVDYTGKLMQ